MMAVAMGPAFSQKKDTYKVSTVVIDPGHGGAKPGALGSKAKEKDITLAVAKKFGKLVSDNYPDVKVIYTRTTDVDISLAERAHIANRNKANLFISIHANSHPTTTPTGVETFVMGLSESKANLEVARKENADILLEADYKNNSDYQGFDPNAPETYVMLAMFQNAFIDKSLNFAQAIQTQYKQNLKTINRGVKQAELYVLYKTSMPSVLTEIGFISNPKEEAYMMSEEGQAQIAICLFNAFMNYKATEEGSNKPSNPVINIKGAKKEAPVEQPAVAENVQPKQPAVVEPPVEQPKVAPVAPAVEQKEPAPVEQRVETPMQTPKPVPSAQMPQRVVPTQPAETPVAQPAPAPAPKPTPAPAPAPAPKPAPVVQPQPQYASNGVPLPVNTASSDKNFYTVQFMLHDRELKPGNSALDGIEEFDIIRKKMGLAYVTGRFASFKEATDYCEIIKSKTKFKDAWAFNCRLADDEKPVASYRSVAKPAVQPTQVPETRSTETTEVQPAQIRELPPMVESSDVTDSVDVVVYRIHFMTSLNDYQKGDANLHGITDFVKMPSDYGIVYLAGYYLTRRQAEQRCASIKARTPFKEAIVVAYRNGVRIPLD